MESFNREEIERYERAKKHVENIKGFYGNFISYVLVILFLAFINLRYTPEHIWFYWPMLGWGVGVLFHGIKVFNWFPFLSKDWEQKKIKQYMEEEKNNQEFK
ncbi:MAG: 2TM domain-containing protein [Bacteroidota bacterium]